ncbi:MAG: DoxX family protein [Acidobacteriota bacterium]
MQSTREGAIRIASPGHAVFAAAMVGLGLVGLIQGKFTPTWYGVPKGFPGRELLAYLCALVSLVAGVGLLWRRTAVVASRLLLAYLLLWLLLFRLSHIFTEPKVLDSWWSFGDTAVMAAAAWVLYVWFAGATGDKGLRIARALYALALIPFGVAHFINLKDTAGLVPGWMPWHLGWAAFTGAAFLVAGVAMLFGVYARLAATLSAAQMGLFTLLIWVPMVLTPNPNAFQWSEFIDSCALTAAAWVVADSYRGVPWLAVRKR